MPSQQPQLKQHQQQQTVNEHPHSPVSQKSPFHSRSNSTSSFFASYPIHTNTQTPLSDNVDPLPQKRLRVAVIGSGLAGLTVAHLLSSLHTDQGHGDLGVDVHLFEKAQSLGMDSASLAVNCPCQACAIAQGRNHHGHGGNRPDQGQNHHHPNDTHLPQGERMDVPMRSFFPEYYPNLVRLYRSIGVKFRDAENTLSCFNVDNDNYAATSTPKVQDPYLSSRSYKASLTSTVTLPDVPPFSFFNPFPFSRRVLGYCRIARDYLRILFVSKEFLSKGHMMDIGKHPIEWGNGRVISLREFLEGGGYSFEFAEFFVPLFACICTCSFERMMEYPACVVLEYVARCMPFGRMQVVDSSVNDVAEALSENIRTVHYGTKIEHVLDSRSRKQPRRKARKEEGGDDSYGHDDGSTENKETAETRGAGPVILVDSDGQEWAFDHVIFATQANQAAATLAGVQRRKRYDDNDDEDSGTGSNDSDQILDSRLSTAATNSVNNQDAPSVDSIPTTHPFYESIKILSKFPYERTQVIVHTDTTSFLSRDPKDWRLLNIAKSSSADVLASPLNKFSKDLEPEMALRSKKAKSPRTSLFSLRVSSPLSKSNSRFRLPLSMSRRGSSQLGITTSQSLRAHFEDLESSLKEKAGGRDPMTMRRYNSAMATHLLRWDKNVEGGDNATPVLQTTNPLFPPRPGTVIASAWFERPVVDPQSMKALDELHLRMDRQTVRRRRHNRKHHRRHRRTSSTASSTTRRFLQDKTDDGPEAAVNDGDKDDDEEEDVPVSDRVWFVGSYASPGIPLSEGCVVSAVQVVDRIIASEPSLRLAPSTNAPADSFLKMDIERRQARQQREQSEQHQKKRDGRRSTVSSEYFANSWKDVLWMDETDRSRGHQVGGNGESSSKVWKSTNVFVEVAGMMMLYFVAVVQWWMVVVVESLGGSGRRWAHA
ncbi:hypothetical protein BG015_008040 [Linnemannia schmuckeri]|uniref:Amine oxidase domain-containing protein n=1 Tax=Linnemannia schmuckeri TaxID=64567 RepID=A0A9P5RZN5_9FUNG|nr:hypothetical protein BG015_008040 [Linnemannia schmuckeri]